MAWKDKERCRREQRKVEGFRVETAQPFGTQLASIAADTERELQVLESHECSLSFHRNSAYCRFLWVWFDVLIIS